MKILFLCSAIENGMDGIGDYTMKLSQECFLQGIECIVAAINDKYVSNIETGLINNVKIYRLPKRLPWKVKADELTKILNDNSPVDWISIQFVGYGFNSKGLVWNVIPFFSHFKAWKMHIMMHELWVAEEREASVRMKILGAIQKRSILSLIRTIKPKVVQTSIPLYKKMLA